jgi:hypothetical protein
MAEAAYADLETPGQVLNEDGEDTDRNTPRLRLSACVLSASTMY